MIQMRTSCTAIHPYCLSPLVSIRLAHVLALWCTNAPVYSIGHCSSKVLMYSRTFVVHQTSCKQLTLFDHRASEVNLEILADCAVSFWYWSWSDWIQDSSVICGYIEIIQIWYYCIHKGLFCQKKRCIYYTFIIYHYIMMFYIDFCFVCDIIK